MLVMVNRMMIMMYSSASAVSDAIELWENKYKPFTTKFREFNSSVVISFPSPLSTAGTLKCSELVGRIPR
jgi:hypothetical protein